jgi:hypothetical protein
MMGGKKEIDVSTVVVAADDCLSTTLDGESVILHMGEGEYYGFNQVATDIWEQIQEPTRVEELCEHLVSEYEIAYERSQEDAVELLVELDEKGLVEVDG